MKGIIKILDAITEYMGRVIGFLVYVLLFVVLYEVVSRKVFGKPTIWGFELSYILYAVMFMLGFAYTLKHKMHIGIDVFYSRFSLKTQGVLDIIGYLIFFFPFMYLAVTSTWGFASQSWQMHELSQSPWAPRLYPFKAIMPIAFIMLTLQGISHFIKSIYKVKGEEIK